MTDPLTHWQKKNIFDEGWVDFCFEREYTPLRYTESERRFYIGGYNIAKQGDGLPLPYVNSDLAKELETQIRVLLD